MTMKVGAKRRKLVELGGSLVVSMPREYVREAGLRKGDMVAIAYDSLFVVVNPNMPKTDKPEEETTTTHCPDIP